MHCQLQILFGDRYGPTAVVPQFSPPDLDLLVRVAEANAISNRHLLTECYALDDNHVSGLYKLQAGIKSLHLENVLSKIDTHISQKSKDLVTVFSFVSS